MTENAQQDQGQTTPQDTSTTSESSQRQSQQRSGEESSEPRIPKSRFDEVNRRMKEAERQLQESQAERERAEEEKAQNRGEIEKVAEQRKKKVEKLEAENKALNKQLVDKDRLNTWQSAAQGIIRPEAISDAFIHLNEEDFTGIDNTDEEAFRNLAQNLVEVRGYLAADGGPRGAGSGGSSRPVLAGVNSQDNKHQPIFHKAQRKRRPWK